MEILKGHGKFLRQRCGGNQVRNIVLFPPAKHLSIIEHTDIDESLKGQGRQTAGGESGGKDARENSGQNYPAMSLCET